MPKKVWVHPSKVDGKHQRLYLTWRGMLGRCSNPTARSYQDYGGRGISVCDEWLSYDVFYEWAYANGYTDELTIDRIDNNKGYSPENCRWTDKVTQNRNKRNVRDVNGETIPEIAERLGLNYATVYRRVTHGKDIEAPLTVSKSNRFSGSKKGKEK